MKQVPESFAINVYPRGPYARIALDRRGSGENSGEVTNLNVDTTGREEKVAAELEAAYDRLVGIAEEILRTERLVEQFKARIPAAV